MKKSLSVTLVALGALAAGQAYASEWDDSFGPFTLNTVSLAGSVEVNAPCLESWKVLTEIDKLQKLAPHLGLAAVDGQKTAEHRGDVVRVKTQKLNGVMTGEFVLTTPVPFKRISAVLAPDRGPWVRIQQWDLITTSDKTCRLDYDEAYNEVWLKAVQIMGSDFIKSNRDHHIHVILRRIKNMAEGREPGAPDEVNYLFEDAKTFPEKFRVTTQAQAKP